MAGVYDSMAATFLKDGLNLAAVTAIRQFYGRVSAQPEPLFYEHFPTPLEKGAVRLVVFRPVQADPLIQLAHSACHDILGSLPPGMLLPYIMHVHFTLKSVHYVVIKPLKSAGHFTCCPASKTMLLNARRV